MVEFLSELLRLHILVSPARCDDNCRSMSYCFTERQKIWIIDSPEGSFSVRDICRLRVFSARSSCGRWTSCDQRCTKKTTLSPIIAHRPSTGDFFAVPDQTEMAKLCVSQTRTGPDELPTTRASLLWLIRIDAMSYAIPYQPKFIERRNVHGNCLKIMVSATLVVIVLGNTPSSASALCDDFCWLSFVVVRRPSQSERFVYLKNSLT